jgi:2-C-methyl-D-erythritol 4-phosphate cytidylyltransferase
MEMKMAVKKFSAAAVVVAAGTSSRMGGKVRKPYLTLRGKPVLAWTLSALAKVKGLKQIVLVTRAEDRALALRAAKKARLPARIKLIAADGGARRQDSVLNGLKACSAQCDLVLIHDAARPFPPQQAMYEACQSALSGGAAILAVRVKDTVKREADDAANGARIETTVPRAGLWLAQTPQVFQRSGIIGLFEKLGREAPDREVTDDATVCEILGQPVALIESSETNLKVTRPEDLRIAEAFLRLKLAGG